MAMSADKIKSFLVQAFPDAVIEMNDFRGDQDHFAITLKTKAFRGKTRIQQHQMVYEALQGHVGTDLHALSLKTQALEE